MIAPILLPYAIPARRVEANGCEGGGSHGIIDKLSYPRTSATRSPAIWIPVQMIAGCDQEFIVGLPKNQGVGESMNEDPAQIAVYFSVELR